ncbi:MAG: carboxylesterase/lipase family protein [Candidatus Acidiferrales bacterium]
MGESIPRMRSVIVGFAFFVLLVWAPVLVAGAPIHTTSGRVSGVALSHGIEVFKGIPFAAPPVGNLRWRPPQPALPWRGVRQADHFGPPCMQSSSPRRQGPWTQVFESQLRPSEDCLYLNIWTTAKRPTALRPVMVWIYGGAFTGGAGSVAIYDGAELALKNVVVVNFNYRLGAFGFLAYPGLTDESSHHSSGNYGLLDQIAALQWVQRNIAAFGGAPHKVTIFGQSAGGMSVWALMQSPLARGLFARAITMSGEGVIPIPSSIAHRSLAEAEKEGQQFAAKLGARSVARLRGAPADRIVQASGRISWMPIFDGWVLRADWHPPHEVCVISGMVADDMGIGYYGNSPPSPVTLGALRSTLKDACGSELATCQKLYPADNNRQAAQMRLTALQDRARVSLYKWAVQQAQDSPQVYIYYFNRKIPWPQHPEYGVFHSSELPYVFDNLRLLRRPWQPVDQRIADEMSSYWTNFAKTGSPNASGLPKWPAFRPRNESVMQLGARMEPIPLASTAQLRFWIDYLKKPLGF